MSKSFKERLIDSIRDAARYDSGNLVAPVAVLWPDPDQQWTVIIGKLQEEMPELMVLGDYSPAKRTGPALWLKCMVSRILPEANWDESLVPVIYLPGISKNDMKNLSQADPAIAPLMEYQYTGVLWTHRNGKEWTVTGFLQNREDGLGLNLNQDAATKDASLKALQKLYEGADIRYPSHVNSDFLYQLLFSNEVQSILEWMCKGDDFLNSMELEKQQVFTSICQRKYGFVPDYKNIRSIAEKLGMKTGEWLKVWNYYALAPRRFTEIESLLELAKPDDMGNGLFAIPEDSWPQLNAEAEEKLRKSFEETGQLSSNEVVQRITELEEEHGKRRDWVWAELGRSNLAMALKHLDILCKEISHSYDSTTIESISSYYKEKGYIIDHSVIRALTECKSEKEQQAVKLVLKSIYTPWLERLTQKFQELVSSTPEIFTNIEPKNEESEFILFIDAFRYDLAKKWTELMIQKNYRINIETTWSPLPSLTPTCKPFFSPVAERVSRESEINDFRPRTPDQKDLTPYHFEAELDNAGYTFPKTISELAGDKKIWMEIGKIDKYGHNEQSALVHRIDELFDLIDERIKDIFDAGFRRIRIVTDHGWLLVPGGMPSKNLPKDHIETRWGRCAILKEGVPSELLHLPWFWNRSVMIAYAPGISFFKANNEYAHGGISLQECLVPVITVETEGMPHQPVSMEIKWTGLKCTVDVEGVRPGYKIEVRTRHTDEKSVISKTKSLTGDEKVSLFIENADYESTAAFIVITDEQGIVLEKRQTIVGE